MKAAYENWSAGWWDESHIQKLIDIFPEGQLVIVADDEIAGCALSLIVDYDKFGDNHTYKKITGDYTFSGIVIGTFTKLSGLQRYAVEDDRGVIHIYTAKNLALRKD